MAPWYTESWFIANQYLDWIQPWHGLAADRVQQSAISGANYEVDIMGCSRQDVAVVKTCHHAVPHGRRTENIKVIYWLDWLREVLIGVNYLSECHTLRVTIIIPADVANWIMMLNTWMTSPWQTTNAINVRRQSLTSRCSVWTSCSGEFGSTKHFHGFMSR